MDSHRQHSYRQTPPKDRTALWAALIVAGMLLAGMVGWIANSIANSHRNDQQQVVQSPKKVQDKNSSEDLALEAREKSGNGTQTNGTQTKGIGAKPNGRDLKTDVQDARIQTSRSEFTKPGSSDSKTSDNSNREASQTKEISSSLPKLSDLTSLKNGSAKSRVKFLTPTTKRKSNNSAKKVAGSNAGPAVDPSGDSQKPTSPSSRALKSAVNQSKPDRTSTIGQNQFAIPQSSQDIVFYQELIVDRNPKFGIEGISELDQKFKYRTVSKMTVHPGDRNGFRKVSQKVVAAHLVSADSISKKSMEESVKKLIGKEFQFTLDRKQKLVDFKGEKDEPKTIDLKDLTSIEGLTGDGFMVSSVMDLDGWKEMAQLTFLLPDDKKKKWKDQMSHDWGELGKWLGETRFEKKNETNGLLRIDYSHWMRYDPTSKGKSKLPFSIGEKSFESTEAGGRLFFDRKKNRIDSLIERFRVSGSISASLLGSSTKLNLQEIQTFQLKLHDQNPQ